MLSRLSDEFSRKLKGFPAVALLGPRQCGKTTFIRRALPDWRYLDLEKPSDYGPLAEDPERRLEQLGDRIVFDEAQRLPALFEVLRSRIDEHRGKPGRYVLLGSAAPTLVKGVSESMAGRVGIMEMTPFRWEEVAGTGANRGLETLWYRGGFPDPFLARSDPSRWDWFESYTRTFIERDLASYGVSVSAPRMRKILMMLAHSHGGIWNASQLAASLGVSYHMVNHYVDVLEQTFLARRLTPYHANIGKRLVKSPKVYLRDSGLLHYFLGIQSPESLGVHPGRGASWEGFILEQLTGSLTQHRPGAQFHYWRTQAGAEADLLVDTGSRLVPFEIKLHSSPGLGDFRGLATCMADLKLKAGYVLCPCREDYRLGPSITVLSAERILRDPRRLANLVE